jgi:hypothetical protein
MRRIGMNTRSELLAPDNVPTYRTTGPDSIYETNVILYSKPNMQGTLYLVSNGSYTGDDFNKNIAPDNIFSLSIPPNTKIKLYCGTIYDDGQIGSMEITNVLNEPMYVAELPQQMQGKLQSMIVIKQKNKTKIDNTKLDKIEDFESLKISSKTQKRLKERAIKTNGTDFIYYTKLLSCLVAIIWITTTIVKPKTINKE